MPQTTASTYDPALGGPNGSPNRGGCGVPSGQIPWSVAHKTLPCGTVVTIVGPDNKTIVQVPVGDRGPYVTGRDLDLRPDVAAALGSDGLIKVTYHGTAKRIDLKKYALSGGDANAFEVMTNLVANSSDPLGKKTQKEGEKQLKDQSLAASIPGLSTLNSIGDAVKAIVEALFDPSTYFRLGKGLLGGILIVLGVGSITYLIANKVSSSPAGKAVGKVAATAAL